MSKESSQSSGLGCAIIPVLVLGAMLVGLFMHGLNLKPGPSRRADEWFVIIGLVHLLFFFGFAVLNLFVHFMKDNE
jgi:hypothetical protein